MSTFKRFNLLFSVGLALVAVAGVWFGARSVAGASGADPVSPAGVSSPTAPTAASLHNPTFDNHLWYEFRERYQSSYYAGSWVPDDDTAGGPQDWRLWFLDGTAIVESDPEEVYAHHGEGVQMRPYDWGKESDQVAGLYQVIQDTTPCFTYEFQMYGQSRPEDPADYRDAALKVGIDQEGWHPDTANDPAVHTDFPGSTVWGPAHDYKFTYNSLTVTAEALNDSIVVYTYGDAPGGRYHRVLWDTGSFRESAPQSIYDPDDPSTPGGINNLVINAGRDAATVQWDTDLEALGQLFYISAEPGNPAPSTYTNTVYLPLVRGTDAQWIALPLNETPTTDHSFTITNLLPDHTYKLVAAARGPFGGQCVTWVSGEETFTTNP
jgi:hypothetical protein